jgi:Glucodextranase, domain B
MKKLLPIIALVIVVAGLAGWVVLRRSYPAPQSIPEEKTANTQEESATPTPTATQQQKTVVAADEKTHQVLTLTISAPANGATVTNPAVAVKGKTSPNAEVFVNEAEGKADASGNFSIGLTLDEGENYLIIMANDAQGNVAEKELTITYDSGQ